MKAIAYSTFFALLAEQDSLVNYSIATVPQIADRLTP
jgi:hypothetical protein